MRAVNAQMERMSRLHDELERFPEHRKAMEERNTQRGREIEQRTERERAAQIEREAGSRRSARLVEVKVRERGDWRAAPGRHRV